MRRQLWTLLLISNLALATVPPQCTQFEASCAHLIAAQDAQIERLRSEVKECTDKCAEEVPLIPAGVVFAGGILAGLAAAFLITRN